jgi:ABC-type transporter Mla maintaining outer membrane lipid asymmetry ATPase subunit MlaF
MCAIGRALMSQPRLLLLDEPSAGLAPVVVRQVFALLERIRASGLTVLIVEQNVHQVLRVVDRAYLLEAGTIRASRAAQELLASKTIHEAYLAGRVFQPTEPSTARRRTTPGVAPVWVASSTTTTPLTRTVVRVPVGYWCGAA